MAASWSPLLLRQLFVRRSPHSVFRRVKTRGSNPAEMRPGSPPSALAVREKRKGGEEEERKGRGGGHQSGEKKEKEEQERTESEEEMILFLFSVPVERLLCVF